MQKKITYIVSNIDKALAFEWVASFLDRSKFTLNFILINSGDSVLEKFLNENKIAVKRVTYSGKKNLFSALINTVKILRNTKPDVVHTHLFDANLIGLFAAWLCRIPKRIHTRHHATFHHVYHPGAVKLDRIINFLSTDIVAISENVKNILIQQEHVSRSKVCLIHHGFFLESFFNVKSEEVDGLKKIYNPANAHPVIGVISRYTEWKGIQFIIPAFNKLLEKYPDALLILANTTGEYQNQIRNLLNSVPRKNYSQIRFENNIFALYKLFDVFVHVPIDSSSEAFGQTYVEALAAQVPSVFTLSGVASEFITDHSNALVVPYRNEEAIYNAIVELLANQSLRESVTARGKKDVEKKFSLNKMISSVEDLYLT